MMAISYIPNIRPYSVAEASLPLVSGENIGPKVKHKRREKSFHRCASILIVADEWSTFDIEMHYHEMSIVVDYIGYYWPKRELNMN